MHFPRFFWTASWSLLSISLSHAVLLTQVTDIPTNVAFDFIIVGGGNAGNVVANRLSENPNVKVLVLEAGPSNDDVLMSQVPFFSATLVSPSPYEWNYTTTSQSGLGGRSIAYPRGHILGGSSSTNWLVYTRGSAEDFDRYASVTGDSGWSWANMLPYFKKSEKWTAPTDNHDTTGQYDPSLHGTNGIAGVSLSGHGTGIDSKVITATSQLGGKYAFNLDMNSGNELGIGWAQASVSGGSRSSSATSYLAPQFLARSNLWVVVNAQVSRVLQTSATLPIFRGVEFRQSSGGPLQTLTATKEVILSAGAVGTPQILLNSGIGKTSTLSALGITPRVNLPDVGENLADHTVISLWWEVQSTDTFDNIRRDAGLLGSALSEWQTSKTGPLVAPILDHIAFARLDNSIIGTSDTAAGPNSPHYEFIISNGGPPGPLPPTGNFLTLTTVLVSPSSRGSIKLQSNDPFAAPIIDPALLKTSFDKVAMREAAKGASEFLTAPVWSGYIGNQAGSFAGVTSDAALDSYIAQNAGTLFHPVGTARMTPKYASTGVTDPDLRVKKVFGLRIVDVSILPYIPSAHTQATAYAIGERASDLIKASYGL